MAKVLVIRPFDEILGSESARLELWHRISNDDTIGLTHITSETLESMLRRGETSREMAERLGITRALANTRRHSNGRRILEALQVSHVSLFEELLEGEYVQVS